MGIRTTFNSMGGFQKIAENVAKVLSSYYTTWFIDKDGNLYGCGQNTSGQQGRGNSSGQVFTFTKRASDVIDIAINPVATFYINSSKELMGTGQINSIGSQTSFTKYSSTREVVKVVTAGNTDSQIVSWYLTSNGNLYGQGSNSYGQQGNGNTSEVTSYINRATNVASIACSLYTTWNINSNGDLYGCGAGYYGQQGSGNLSNFKTFTKRASNVEKVVCSNEATWYINSSGDLYGCGNNYYGQQGNGSSGSGQYVAAFTLRTSLANDVSCSEKTTWYIDNNGDLYGCGSNSNGQQGNGPSSTSTSVNSFSKRASNVKKVICSDSTTWYIDNNGDLYGCGSNSNGQQGVSSSSNVYYFTKRASNVKDVVCAENTTWYIDEDNNLYGCGYGQYGQQGNGSTSNVLTFQNKMQYLTT